MYNLFNIVVAYCYCEFIYEMTAVQLMTDVSYLLWNLYNRTIVYFGLTKTNIHCCFDFLMQQKHTTIAFIIGHTMQKLYECTLNFSCEEGNH